MTYSDNVSLDEIKKSMKKLFSSSVKVCKKAVSDNITSAKDKKFKAQMSEIMSFAGFVTSKPNKPASDDIKSLKMGDKKFPNLDIKLIRTNKN